MALPTNKEGKIVKPDFFDHAVEINRLAQGLGTFSNPVSDPSAPRPTGLRYVVWACLRVPDNWQVGDFNIEVGK